MSLFRSACAESRWQPERVRRNWVRVVGAVVVVTAVALLVWANRREIPAAAHALRTADGFWLAIGAVVWLAWCLDWILLHLASRRITGVGGYSEFVRLAPVTLSSIALNLAVKSGNVAGLAAFTSEAQRRGTSPGRVTGAYLSAAQLAEVAFIGTLGAGMGVVWVDGRVTRSEIVALVVFTIGIVVRMGSLVAAVRSREVLRRVWTWPARFLDKVRGKPEREHDTSHADELYEAVAAIRARPRAAVPAVVFAVAVDLIGATILWASMAAVGAGDRPVVALVSYAVSTLFGIVGVLPGGLGFVEVGAAAVLASYGTPLGVAAAAVLVFRVFVFWLPLAVGGLITWWQRRRVLSAGA